MSKPIADFFRKILSNPTLINKFKPSIPAGDRIVPSRTPKNDASYQCRIDAGELVNGWLNIVLQVNKEATSAALKNWLTKNSTHSKLATGRIPVKNGRIEAADVEKTLADLEVQAKENIKKKN